jgi:sulfur carrier protein ThiS adenylyltransferase
MPKTQALKSQLVLINPFVEIETSTVKITEENAVELFKDYDIVCEAFDNAKYKAVLVNSLLTEGGKKIVAASGLVGFESSNKIKTKKVFKNLYLCGDSVPPEKEGIGLMAPRVTVCAGHQANMLLRLLLGMEEV